jgi:hypothetical protein
MIVGISKLPWLMELQESIQNTLSKSKCDSPDSSY